MIESNPIYKYVACCICQSKTTRAHRLPALSTSDEKLLRYAKWVNFAAIENVYNKRKYYWVCEIHFEDNAFCNHLKLKLLRTAIPTLKPPIYEGPSTEDGTPAGPTEPKDETLLKIFEEVVNRQCKNEPAGKRRKFYNFLSISPGETTSQEKENHFSTDIQSVHLIKPLLSEDSNQASLVNPRDSIKSTIDNDEENSPNRSFKTPGKTTKNLKSIEEDCSGSTSSSFIQRKRPLILKKIPLSSKSRSIIRPSSVSLLNLSKTHSKADSSDCLINPEPISSQMKIVKKISAIDVKKPESVDDVEPNILSSVKTPEIDNVIMSNMDHPNKEDFNISSTNENEIADSVSSDVNLTSNEKEEPFDILSAAINNSDILFSDTSCMDEEVICINEETDNNKHNESLKYVKKQPASKKKYYDPVLIDSVLNKMKLKKNGPVCVVTLEKKPDRLFKGFSKSKLVTLYKQQINKNRKNKKANQGNGSNEITKKVRKKRRCTCSIHCHRRSNSSKISSPVVNVNSGVGVKFEGTAINPNVMNIDPDLADEELFKVDNVFNVSTILTNVHDRSQIEQLCQMLIESIFRLKSLNIEGTMAKLQVYLAQVPESGVSRSAVDQSSTCNMKENFMSNNSNQDVEMNDVESNTLNNQEVILNSFQENDCNQIPSLISLTNEKEMPIFNEVPITAELPNQPANDSNINNPPQTKPKNVKLRLSTFHDHSYVKQESNFIFEKPEYLVKLINIETYRCPRKTVKPPQSGASKKEAERHKKACLKLNNRIMHLRELIKKKNKNIKSMHRKIKYLGGIVCQEKGIKRVKYPKIPENPSEKWIDSSKAAPEEHLQVSRREEANKMFIDMNIDPLRMDNVVSINSFDSTTFFQDNTQIKAKKAPGTKMKKNVNVESFDVLYENLIEELCCNEMEY